MLIQGTVLVMLADTLAAHSIGGFKIGVGFALRKCRNCLATAESMRMLVSSVYYNVHDFILQLIDSFFLTVQSQPVYFANS